MKKHSLLYIMLLLLSLITLSSCSNSNQASTKNTNEPISTETKNKNINIVTTIFPIYDWTTEIVGTDIENTTLTMLLDSGVDLHSYQPTVDDILKISNADIFIYVGGTSDAWVSDVLKEVKNPDIKVINLLDVLGDDVKKEELIDGMEIDDHSHEEEDDDHSEDDLLDNDEHVWLSLRNATVFVNKIANTLSEVNPENKALYLDNANTFNNSLSELDKKYIDALSNSPKNTILLGDRFPFRYLVDDYNLYYYAPFLGCSAETEASFETIIFLSNKVNEFDLNYVITLEGSNTKIAKTIIDSTENKNQEILTMDSMQSIDKNDVENGANYLKIMENNLTALKKALE